MEIRKLTRDNKVGIILAKKFNTNGWYTSHRDLQLLFLPELVSLIESNEYKNAANPHQLVHKLLTSMGIWDLIVSGSNLTVEWLPVNTRFKVESRLSVVPGYCDEIIVTHYYDWLTA